MKKFDPDHKREYMRAYNAEHREENKARCRARYRAHRAEAQEASKKYRESHTAELKEYMRAYRETHSDELRIKKSEYYKRNKERERGRDRKRKHGVTPAEYELMLADQGGVCAVCGSRGPNLAIDHDHRTLVVRGLLCANCNRGIGLLGDDQSVLKAAIEYLSERG